ncbi:MAG: hypothetical protein WAN35_06075 [Terracidiphilus sp.]
MRRKEEAALVQLGEYSEAQDSFKEAVEIYQKFVAADPRDSRAITDLKVALNFEALGFETAADAALGASKGDRRRNLAEAQKLWTQIMGIIGQARKQEPTDGDWLLARADAQARLGTIQSLLQSAAGSVAMTKQGICGMKELARKQQTSARTLDLTASDLLIVEPKALRDSHFAVTTADRAMALKHRKTPSMLLTLAQAYRATGQIRKSITVANEGLALRSSLPEGA